MVSLMPSMVNSTHYHHAASSKPAFVLYGSKNWVLNHSVLNTPFQAEPERRVFACTKLVYYVCKVSCLFHVCNRESTSLSTQVFRSIAVSDVTSMNIVKQCYFLSHFTDGVLNNSNLSLRKCIIESDHKRVVEKSKEHPSLLYVLCVAKDNLCLNYGMWSLSSMAEMDQWLFWRLFPWLSSVINCALC